MNADERGSGEAALPSRGRVAPMKLISGARRRGRCGSGSQARGGLGVAGGFLTTDGHGFTRIREVQQEQTEEAEERFEISDFTESGNVCDGNKRATHFFDLTFRATPVP